MSCKCHGQNITNPKFERQSRANTITNDLNKCKLWIEKIAEKIGGSLNPDTEVLKYLGHLNDIMVLLIDVDNRSDDRALDHEDRLEKLEHELEELKKRFPVCDGK